MVGMDELGVSLDMFKAYVPFEIETVEKSGDRSLGRITGIASSETVDADQEVILQDGLEWDFFLRKGTLTYEHPIGALNIVGEPISIERMEHNGVAATKIIGVLYLDDPLGKALWNKATTMKKAGGNRTLGFSVEGRVPPGARDGRTIKAARVHSVAISPVPKNPDSWWEPIQASMKRALAAGHSLGEVLQRAEGIGYPDQSQGVGFDKLTAQSIQGGIDSKWLKGVTVRDMAILHILKELPSASWAQGEAVFAAISSKFKHEEN